MNPREHSAVAWVEVACRRADLARVMLRVAIGVLAVSWAWTILGILLMGGIGDLGSVWTDWWDPLILLVSGIWLLTHLITGIGVISSQRAFTRSMRWFGVVHPNPNLAWGSWAWFVPFANLFVPYQAFRQLTVTLPEPARPRMGRSVGRWWVFWLIGSVSSSVAAKLSLVAETPRSWIVASGIDLVGSAALIGAGLILIRILEQLSTGYSRLAAEREKRLAREAEVERQSEPPMLQLDMPFQAINP